MLRIVAHKSPGAAVRKITGARQEIVSLLGLRIRTNVKLLYAPQIDYLVVIGRKWRDQTRTPRKGNVLDKYKCTATRIATPFDMVQILNGLVARMAEAKSPLVTDMLRTSSAKTMQ
jgi:hypothetical protein